MKINALKCKRIIVAIVAVLQLILGALLLTGTIGITLTAFQTVRNESAQLADNLTTAADALESSREAYMQSASSLFGLTDAMDDVGGKLVDVSEAILEVGRRFTNYGKTEDSAWYGKVLPFTEWFRNSGERLKEVADDVESVSKALSGQSQAIKNYRENAYEKSLAAISKSVDSLRRSAQILDGGRSAKLWWGFVCILGFCVSMLFFANGILLMILAKYKGTELNVESNV